MAPSLRIWTLGVLLAALLIGGVAHACTAGPAAGREPLPAPPSPLPAPAPAVHLAGVTPADDGGLADAGPARDGADVLAAVVAVRRVCALVDRGSFAAARWLFADGARWPAGLWRRLRHLRFRSARIVREREADPCMIRLNVRVATPAARDGIRTLSFTLGRVGADGEWLVYAVSTPIPPRERGLSCPPSPLRRAAFASR